MVQTEIGRVTVTLDIPPPVPTRDDGPLPPFKFDGAAAGPGAAQTRRMAEALNDQFVTGPAVEVTWTNKPGENWWGVTQLRTGQVQLNAAKIGDAEATTAAAKETFGPNPFFVANGQKVTKAEMALIHEWGHTMEDGTTFIANPTRSSETGPQPRLHKLYKELLADEPGLVDKPAWYDARDVEVLSPRIWPSQYAGTNADELMAEAFADWVINPDTAHVTSKRIAKELGWPKPKTPLAELSALSGSS